MERSMSGTGNWATWTRTENMKVTECYFDSRSNERLNAMHVGTMSQQKNNICTDLEALCSVL